MRLLPVLLGCFFLTCYMSLAQAAGPVSVTPASAQVNGAGTTVLTLSWRVGVESRVPRRVTVTSAPARISTGGTVGGTLRETLQHPGGGLVFVTIRERLVVNRTTAARITGARSAVLTRSFSDFAGVSRVASVRLQTTSGGGLAVRHAALAFEDGSRFRVITPPVAPLKAVLKLTTSGRGQIVGSWQVTGPQGAAGGFRIIGRVREVSAGARRLELISPTLPVDRPGLYQVRFVPSPSTARGISLTVPELRYTVAAAGATRSSPGASAPIAQANPGLVLIAPGADATLDADTRFRWQAAPGAVRYRLEFFDQGAGERGLDFIAAIETQGQDATPKGFTLQKLREAAQLQWRVSAFDAAGARVAVSPLRAATQHSARP